MISGLSSSQAAQPQRQHTSAAKKPLAPPKVDKVQFGRTEKVEEEDQSEASTQEPQKPVGLLERVLGRLVNRIIQFIDRIQKIFEEISKSVSEHLKKSQEQMSVHLAAEQAKAEEEQPLPSTEDKQAAAESSAEEHKAAKKK